MAAVVALQVASKREDKSARHHHHRRTNICLLINDTFTVSSSHHDEAANRQGTIGSKRPATKTPQTLPRPCNTRTNQIALALHHPYRRQDSVVAQWPLPRPLAVPVTRAADTVSSWQDSSLVKSSYFKMWTVLNWTQWYAEYINREKRRKKVRIIFKKEFSSIFESFWLKSSKFFATFKGSARLVWLRFWAAAAGSRWRTACSLSPVVCSLAYFKNVLNYGQFIAFVEQFDMYLAQLIRIKVD